tara:strand:- start:3782 stop:5440 length:1659 start_codon:yes stop_codon:yes gene_type:complete
LILWVLLGPALIIGFQAIAGIPSVESYLLSTSWVLPTMVGLFAMGLAADIFSRDEQNRFGDHLACLPVAAPALWFAKVTYLAVASSGFLAWILLSYKVLHWTGLSWGLYMELSPAPEAIVTAFLAVGLSAWFTGLTRQPLLAWLGALMITCPLWTLGGVILGDWYAPILEVLIQPQIALFLLAGILVSCFIAYRPGSDRSFRFRRVAPGVVSFTLVALSGTAWGHHVLKNDVLHEKVSNDLTFGCSPDGRFLVAIRYQGRRFYHGLIKLSHESNHECRVLDLETGRSQALPAGIHPGSVMLGSWITPWWDSEGNLLTMDEDAVLYRNDLESQTYTVAQLDAVLESGGYESLQSQASREFNTWFNVSRSAKGVHYVYNGQATEQLGVFRGAPLKTPGWFAVFEEGLLKRLDLESGEKVALHDNVMCWSRPRVSPCGRWFWVALKETHEMLVFDSQTLEVVARPPSHVPVVGWSDQPGRRYFTWHGWLDVLGEYHDVIGAGTIQCEVGVDQFLLQVDYDDPHEGFQLYSIDDGSRTPLSLDDFGFETLTTGSIQ